MKYYHILLFLFAGKLFSQQITDYQELKNPTATDGNLWKNEKKTIATWGNIDTRYAKEIPVNQIITNTKTTAWQGERVHFQAVVSNYDTAKNISFEIADFVNSSSKNQRFKASARHSGFVRYVMTDELNKDKKGGCGHRKKTDFDSLLVADVIDHHTQKLRVEKNTTQGIWIGVDVPKGIASGIYKSTLKVKSDRKTLKKLALEIEVKEHELPSSSKQKFHLDLWQNPYAVARYYNVTPWSPEHFQFLETEMKRYSEAGGKVITASIIHKPWDGQTYDYFESMVQWAKKKDGSWEFDYTIFDQWVSFMMKLGIDKQINCYSMVPWKLSFEYFDEQTMGMQTIQTKPGEPEYNQMWEAMLKSFAQHLKEKGWFNITHIAMDERPMEVMQEVLKLIKKVDSDYKVSLAGALHQELENDLNDYCVALRMKYDEKTLEKRKKEGKITTYYTSCEEPFPNTFTFSRPAESEWLGWYAQKANLDGYLRWALNSWVEKPLQDTRFRTWAAGDTYLVYPNDRTSIRFERLYQGIQAYEKIRILKNKFSEKNDTISLQKINEMLSLFNEEDLKTIPAEQVVNKARAILDSF